MLLLGQSDDLPVAGIDLATRTELASRALELRDERQYVVAAGYAAKLIENREEAFIRAVAERERDNGQDRGVLELDQGSEAVDGVPGVPEPTHVHPSDPAPLVYSGSIPDLIRRIFREEGVGEWADLAVSVASCESGFNPNAIGGSGEVGLFQLLPVDGLLPTFYSYGFTDWASPEQQATFVARYILANSWSPWSCA